MEALTKTRNWIDLYVRYMNAQQGLLRRQVSDYDIDIIRRLDSAIVKTRNAKDALNVWSTDIQILISDIFTLIEKYTESRMKIALLYDRMHNNANDVKLNVVNQMKRNQSYKRSAQNERNKLQNTLSKISMLINRINLHFSSFSRGVLPYKNGYVYLDQVLKLQDGIVGQTEELEQLRMEIATLSVNETINIELQPVNINQLNLQVPHYMANAQDLDSFERENATPRDSDSRRDPNAGSSNNGKGGNDGGDDDDGKGGGQNNNGNDNNNGNNNNRSNNNDTGNNNNENPNNNNPNNDTDIGSSGNADGDPAMDVDLPESISFGLTADHYSGSSIEISNAISANNISRDDGRRNVEPYNKHDPATPSYSKDLNIVHDPLAKLNGQLINLILSIEKKTGTRIKMPTNMDDVIGLLEFTNKHIRENAQLQSVVAQQDVHNFNDILNQLHKDIQDSRSETETVRKQLHDKMNELTEKKNDVFARKELEDRLNEHIKMLEVEKEKLNETITKQNHNIALLQSFIENNETPESFQFVTVLTNTVYEKDQEIKNLLRSLELVRQNYEELRLGSEQPMQEDRVVLEKQSAIIKERNAALAIRVKTIQTLEAKIGMLRKQVSSLLEKINKLKQYKFDVNQLRKKNK